MEGGRAHAGAGLARPTSDADAPRPCAWLGSVGGEEQHRPAQRRLPYGENPRLIIPELGTAGPVTSVEAALYSVNERYLYR
jgi:hypothetical protein